MSQEQGQSVQKQAQLVIVESPFAGDIRLNIKYARDCVNDCLKRGEAPFASHLFYTQTGILRDDVPEERQLGIAAGLAWGTKADKTVVYHDLGITSGMEYGIAAAKKAGRPIEFRRLFKGDCDVTYHYRLSASSEIDDSPIEF